MSTPDNITKALAEALERIKLHCASLADAQVIALEALAAYRSQAAAQGETAMFPVPERAWGSCQAAAIRTLTGMHYTWAGGELWKPPLAAPSPAEGVVAWRCKSKCGLRSYMTQRQYDAQSQTIKDAYEPFRCANCIATHPPAPAVQARVGLTEEQIIRLAGGDDGEPAASWQFDREELVRLYSIWFDAHGIPPCCRGLT